MTNSFDSSPHRRSRLWTAALLLFVFALAASACGGCEDDEASAPEQKPERTTEADDSEDADSMARMREVFGLPMPPSVVRVERRAGKVSVKTDMSLPEVRAFFEARLTDFEILDADFEVRAVGLRDYMPEVYAYGMGPSTYVVYIPPRNEQARAASAGADDAADESSSTDDEPKPIEARKYGEKVMDRTSDGRLLAPGARWGEPYTPPPGTPLHQERYRSNFGRPYGKWVLQ